MNVPLLDLNIQNRELKKDLTNAFNRVIESSCFILGDEVRHFESEVASIVGTDYAIGVSSGTDAILLSLMALGIGPGDEVLVPAFTFFASAGCVARVGATPVFVDSCPDCFNLNVADATKKITEKTKAIIPVHLFGQSADLKSVIDLAKIKKLYVIEDAAQSLGAKYFNQSVGSIGDIGTFSFFPSKNLGGFGDAGMIVTNDSALAEKIRILRVHGSNPKYYHKYIGGNFRLDELQAALLRVKILQLSKYTQLRSENSAYYFEQLSDIKGIGNIECPTCIAHNTVVAKTEDNSNIIMLPTTHKGNFHAWNQYTLRLPGIGKRNELQKYLKSKQIGSEIYYPITLDQQACFQKFSNSDSSIKVAHDLSNEVLSIPIYPELSHSQKDQIIESITEFVTNIV